MEHRDDSNLIASLKSSQVPRMMSETIASERQISPSCKLLRLYVRHYSIILTQLRSPAGSPQPDGTDSNLQFPLPMSCHDRISHRVLVLNPHRRARPFKGTGPSNLPYLIIFAVMYDQTKKTFLPAPVTILRVFLVGQYLCGTSFPSMVCFEQTRRKRP